jgi:hypothetical protein
MTLSWEGTMSFDLYITIGGMCLLADRKTHLEVILPNADDEHQHFPVLFSKADYQPEPTGKSCVPSDPPRREFVVHDVGNGEIRLGFSGGNGYKSPLPLRSHEIVNLRDVTTTPLDLRTARITMKLAAGALTKDLGRSRAAHWRWPTSKDKPRTLATFITWKVSGLTTVVGGQPGISVEFPGGTALFRPKKDVIKMSLFHVVEEELPCNPLPADPWLKPGTKAPHFHSYYSLFQGGSPPGDPAPIFEHGVRPPPLNQPSASNETEFGKTVHAEPEGRRGLRYTCIVAGLAD